MVGGGGGVVRVSWFWLVSAVFGVCGRVVALAVALVAGVGVVWSGPGFGSVEKTGSGGICNPMSRGGLGVVGRGWCPYHARLSGMGLGAGLGVAGLAVSWSRV